MSIGIDESSDTVKMLEQRRSFQSIYGRVMASKGIPEDVRRQIHDRVQCEVTAVNRARDGRAREQIDKRADADQRPALTDDRLAEAKRYAREALMLCEARTVTLGLVERIIRLGAWVEQLEREAQRAAERNTGT